MLITAVLKNESKWKYILRFALILWTSTSRHAAVPPLSASRMQKSKTKDKEFCHIDKWVCWRFLGCGNFVVIHSNYMFRLRVDHRMRFLRSSNQRWNVCFLGGADAESSKFPPPNDLLPQSALRNKNGMKAGIDFPIPFRLPPHIFDAVREKRASITLSHPVRSPIYHFTNNNQFLAVFFYHRSASQSQNNEQKANQTKLKSAQFMEQ